MTSTLHFEFEHWGEALFGTVREKGNLGAAVHGSAIEFIRQNDVPSGGLPQTFTATRE